MEEVTPLVMRHLPQNGFTFIWVLPARMSVMMYAACLETTCLPARLTPGWGQTVAPSGPTTRRIVWRGISTPPSAITPKALIMSIGWTSSVPMLSDTTADVLGG